MCADFRVTSSSPLNKSVSKQLYSFSKSIRFSPAKEPLCKGSYQIKRGAFGSRATSFGYGNKMNLADTSNHPPVGNYELKSQFLKNREKRRGNAFSRDSRANTLVNPEKASAIPGPGTYRHENTLKTSPYKNVSYSMAYKVNDPLERYQNPLGPGQYDTIPALTNNGSYFVSKYSSSGCGRIGREKRSSLANCNNVPGPGKYSYECKNEFNTTGVYFNSKFRNMQAGKFSKTSRMADNRKDANLGPGSYNAFTEFSHLNKSAMRASTSGKY